jgi:membrane protease YdiL (CAAX protease family)
MDIANKKQILTLLGGILIALLFYPVVCYLGFYYFNDTVLTIALHYLVWCLSVLVLYVYALKVEKSTFLIWPEQQDGALFFILSIVALFILQLPGRLLSEIPKNLGWHELWDQHFSKHFWHVISGWYHINVVVWWVCIISWSIATELMFRGYLMPRLSLLFKNKAAAVICTSIIYAVGPFGRRSLSAMIVDFFSGIFFGIHYQKYRNIKILIATRILIDVSFYYAMRGVFMRMNF